MYEIVRTVLVVLVVLILLALALAAVAATVRVIRGPSIIDRMIGADTLMTILISALVADMAIRGHLDTLILVVALAGVASIGTLAVARFTARSMPRRETDAAREGAAPAHHRDDPMPADAGVQP